MTTLAQLEKQKVQIQNDKSLSADQRDKALRKVRKQIRAARRQEGDAPSTETPRTKKTAAEQKEEAPTSTKRQSTKMPKFKPTPGVDVTTEDFARYKALFENQLAQRRISAKGSLAKNESGYFYDFPLIYSLNRSADDILQAFIERTGSAAQFYGYHYQGEYPLLILGPVDSNRGFTK